MPGNGNNGQGEKFSIGVGGNLEVIGLEYFLEIL